MGSTFKAVGIPVLVVSESHVIHVGCLAGELSYIALQTSERENYDSNALNNRQIILNE